MKHPRTFSPPSLCLRYEHAAQVEGNPSRFWLPSAVNGAGNSFETIAKRLPAPWKFQVVVSPRLQAIGLVCCKGGGYLERQSPASTATGGPMVPGYLAWQAGLPREGLNWLWLCCAAPPVSFLRRLNLLLSFFLQLLRLSSAADGSDLH